MLELTVRATPEQAKSIVTSLGDTVEIRSIHEKANGETELEIGVLTEADLRENLFYAFADAKCAILSMVHKKQSLEDVFLALTAEGAVQPTGNQGGDAQ